MDLNRKFMTRKKITYILIIALTVSVLSFLFLPAFQDKKEIVFNHFKVMEQKSMFRKANSLYDEENYQKALEKYQKISTKYPDDPDLLDDIFFSVGRCQKELMNKEEALESFRKIVENYPRSVYVPRSLYYSACIFVEEKDLEKAEEFCDKVLNEYPQAEESTIESINQLKLLIVRLIAERPITNLFEEAQALLNQEKYEESIVKFQELIEKYPDSDFVGGALFSIGWMQKQLGQMEKALVSFEEIINNYPENIRFPEALYHSASIAQYSKEEKSLEKAEEYCDKLLNEYPDIGEYQINLVNQLKAEIEVRKLFREPKALFEEGQYEESLEKLQELIEKYPDSIMTDDALILIGYCYLELEKNDQALVSFEEIIENYPSSRYFPKAIYYSASMYYNRKEFGKAEEYCNKILEWSGKGDNEETIDKIKSLLEKLKNL